MTKYFGMYAKRVELPDMEIYYLGLACGTYIKNPTFFLPSLWDLWDFPTGHQKKAWQIHVILLM